MDASGQYRAYQVTFGLRKYACKQATAAGLVLAIQDPPDCPGKGRTHPISLCSDLCADSRSMCTLQNQCMESWPTSAPTEAPQLEKEEGYLHHLQLQATVGNRDPLYAPPHTSLSRSNSSSKKMQIMHKILYSVFSNWPAVGTNTGGYKPEDTLKIQAVTIFRLYCFTEASQSLLPEPSYQCQLNPFAHILWKMFC